MSWMGKLHETYEQAIQLDLPADQELIPLSHSKQNANIKITIDINGKFLSAKVLMKTPIILPATEKSAGRTGRAPPPHPFADKLQYVAKDYNPKFGGTKPSFYGAFHKLLNDWCNSQFRHDKVAAVLKYVEMGNVVDDLVREKILFVDTNNRLLTPRSIDEIQSDVEPIIFKSISKDAETKIFDQGSALVCWSVSAKDDPLSDTWLDKSIQDSWASYYASKTEGGIRGLCFVTGQETILASNHPSKIIKTKGNAKLISANDFSGFTFLGRFTDDKVSKSIYGLQALGIGLLTTQKSHNALRWLIERQGYKTENQVIIAWAVSGKMIPDPTKDSFSLLDWDDLNEMALPEKENTDYIDHGVDIGQSFANALNKKMAGYRSELGDQTSIVIMVLNAASDGRVSLTYYRENSAKEFIDRLEAWHLEFSWQQRHTIEYQRNAEKIKKQNVIWPVSTPVLNAIANTTYGKMISDTQKKNLFERLVPCIIEGRFFPFDIVKNCLDRTSNRHLKRLSDQYSNPSSELAEWEKDLSVTCALYRGFFNRHPEVNKRRNYSMALETDYHSRDYVYGRLLAIADHIEEKALSIAKENRPTAASRLMQRFSDQPAATWLTIHNGLIPYQHRIKSKWPGMESGLKRLMEDVHELILVDDFNSNAKLSGEYLLGFHCQRKWLREHKLQKGIWVLKSDSADDSINQTENELNEGDDE